MGNGYNHHHLRQHHNLHRSTFLPMLCSKPSIKDVTLPKYGDGHSFAFDDPLSPRVGCMGQVKRHNRVIGFPTTTTTASCKFNNSNNMRYFKLKKLFSTKNLITRTTTTGTSTSSSSSSCGSGNQAVMDGCTFGFNVADLDPPLPVIKKVQKQEDGGDAENLWRRRRKNSGSVASRTLQIQQIQIPNHQCPWPTSV